MAFHLQEHPDLGERQILPVSLGHQFVESAEQLEGIAQDLSLVEALANAGGHLGEKMKTIDILQNVGLAVGDEDDIQLV